MVTSPFGDAVPPASEELGNSSPRRDSRVPASNATLAWHTLRLHSETQTPVYGMIEPSSSILMTDRDNNTASSATSLTHLPVLPSSGKVDQLRSESCPTGAGGGVSHGQSAEHVAHARRSPFRRRRPSLCAARVGPRPAAHPTTSPASSSGTRYQLIVDLRPGNPVNICDLGLIYDIRSTRPTR
jgi:hypothetical protein